MTKSKQPQIVSAKESVPSKAWRTGFVLVADIATEASKQLDAFVSFLSGVGSGGVQLITKSNRQLTILACDTLSGIESAGRTLTADTSKGAHQLATLGRETLHGLTDRASATATALVSSKKAA